MNWTILLVLIASTLTNQRVGSIEIKSPRTKLNVFAPVLSANAYAGRIKENERVVRVEPRLFASDADSASSVNGKICGYDLSWHKHDETVEQILQPIPFVVETLNDQAVLKLKSDLANLDCEVIPRFRLFIRAFDCAPADKRRYSERSSLIITVEDVNEYAPVFTHSQYLFKLHQDQTCDSLSCRVEATDDDCTNVDHRVCGYEIVTKNVPFTIDNNGSIAIRQPLTKNEYQFDVIARDCFPSADPKKQVSEPAHVTFKIIPDCKPSLTDQSSNELLIQSDRIHLFDTIHLDTCEDTCQVEDIVGTVTLDAHGLDSACNRDQCSTIRREYVLLPKDGDFSSVPKTQIRSFDGYAQSIVVNKSDFAGQLNEEFIIRMWMKHASDEENNEKHHIFCKTDEKLKNRHHTALFIQNNRLKLLLRKGPVAPGDAQIYPTEWIWKLAEVNDGQWHSYRFIVSYPTKVDLYVDGNLFVPTADNFQLIKDHPLDRIEGTDDTIFTLGACWHGRAARMVQHFSGQLSALSIEQKEELQRSSDCVQECRQYLDLIDMEKGSGVEFASNSNRSMWILRTDDGDAYEQLLKHIVYRNTFQPLGPSGQRTVSIQTRVKCAGESVTSNLPVFTRTIAIDEPKLPTKIELKGETNYLVPENVMNQGIYLFRNISIYSNALKKTQADISECNLNTRSKLSSSEQIIVPDITGLDKILTQTGAVITGPGSIDTYESLLRQIAFISRSPVKNTDRTFILSCLSARDRLSSNEVRVRVDIEKQVVPPAPVAAILSDKLLVDNDEIRDGIIDLDDGKSRSTRNISDWPLAVVVCVSVGLAGVLVLYLVVRIRSNKRQQSPLAHHGDDFHSQMEWEDDIGLNITVNPLDETKKATPSVNLHQVEQSVHGYSAATSDDDEDDDEEEEHDGQHRHEYSSDDDEEYDHQRIHTRKADHQLEWDDAAIEYGPKKV